MYKMLPMQSGAFCIFGVMKKYHYLFFLIFWINIPSVCFSQTNLVLNPSFEDYFSCPAGLSEVYRCRYWKDPTGATSDYFNICCTGPSPCVPVNWSGYQNARTDVAYCGFAFWWSGGQREYIEGKLTDSLIALRKYCISFYVSLSDSSCKATDRIGAYLSNDSIDTVFGGVLNYPPQIENQLGNFIRDTADWSIVSGAFVATGGEKFITIGNFHDNVNTNIDIVRTSPIDWGAYYYIEDVSVIEMIYDSARAGVDTTICEGDSVQLGTAPCNGCTYQWFPTTGLSNDTTAQPIASPTQTTTYVLTLTDTTTSSIDTCVCRSSLTTTDTVTITVINTFDVANAGAEQTLCKGESVMLGTTACANCFYQWQPFGSLNNSTIAQPTATPTQTTTYFLTMTDSVPPCGKTTTDSVNVIVEDCSEKPIEVYNIFTPNGDTHNDVFYIKNLPANSSLQIFNRWGSKVYESSNYNNAWDGGKVPDGTYFYLLTLPSKEVMRGFVEVRR